MPKGEQHSQAKLTADDVRLIHELLDERDHHLEQAAKLSYPEIGRKFGVHPCHVRRIRAGRNWSHVA